MAGEIISEHRARSNRNAGRHHRGFAGDFLRNPHSERFDRLYEEERTQVQVMPRVFRRLAEAAEQRRKPQPTQTVYAPGSMEWFAANVAPSERWRWEWDHEFESPFAPAASLSQR
jgi:hypothetical protein